jgi:hypothetical protein
MASTITITHSSWMFLVALLKRRISEDQWHREGKLKLVHSCADVCARWKPAKDFKRNLISKIAGVRWTITARKSPQRLYTFFDWSVDYGG